MSELARQMHCWVAYTSIGASTVRGQRSPGLVRRLRELLTEVSLDGISNCTSCEFSDQLNDETERLLRGMPKAARHWGLARKALNIFLRGVTYNWHLRSDFKLTRIESWLELPLDSLTVDGLKRQSLAGSLPRWKGVKYLSQADSDRFQARASEIAADMNIRRIHLDVFLWLDR